VRLSEILLKVALNTIAIILTVVNGMTWLTKDEYRLH